MSLQDISSFSSDSFDIKQWVNDTLKSGENQDKKDVSTQKEVKLYLVSQMLYKNC